MQKIRIGIVGYGNISKGVEQAVIAAPDMELRAIFTRRDPDLIKPFSTATRVINSGEAEKYRDEIDVMLLCGGSAKDLPSQGPHFAAMFNVVDSFDTHAKIPEYLAEMNSAAKNTIAVISSGWDPGLFSLIRLLSESVLPDGDSYTFWGRGVSQGHSDAIRRVKGVRNAIQYTVPLESAVSAVRSGAHPELTPREKHMRECFVVTETNASKDSITNEIVSMPNYFSDYDTIVNFIDDDEMKTNHSKMPHGGFVMHSGRTGKASNNEHLIEFSLKLDSNPEFTGSIMTAYARAAFRLAQEGVSGAKTVFDIPLAYLSVKDREALIRELL